MNKMRIVAFLATLFTFGAFRPNWGKTGSYRSGDEQRHHHSSNSKHHTSSKKKQKDKIHRKMQSASRRVNRGKKSKT